MKKKYIEPMMIVEDFTVSEMVAADCKLAETQITFVKQMNGIPGYSCNVGDEPYFKADTTGMRGKYYDDLCGLFDGNYDSDHDKHVESGYVNPAGGNDTSDMVFTPGFRAAAAGNSKVPESACDVDGSGMNFDNAVGLQCTTDTSLLQNS